MHTQAEQNIGPKGQRKRRMYGMIFLVLAGVTSGYLVATNAEWWHRLIVFPLFAAGFISLLEAEKKVCVVNYALKRVETE